MIAECPIQLLCSLRRRVRISSRSCAASGWWTSPPRVGNPPRRTASCCWTSRALRRPRSSEELPRRGALRRCHRAVRFGRGGLCALRRRAPRGHRRSTPRSGGWKKRPRSCVPGGRSTWRRRGNSPPGALSCAISSPSATPSTSSWPSGRSAIRFRRSAAPMPRWFVVVAKPGEEVTLDAQEMKAPTMDIREAGAPHRRSREGKLRTLDAEFSRVAASEALLAQHACSLKERLQGVRVKAMAQEAADGRWSSWRAGPRRRLPVGSTPFWRSTPMWSSSNRTPRPRTKRP